MDGQRSPSSPGTRSLSRYVRGEHPGLCPVLVIELGDEHLDVFFGNAVGVNERLRDAGDQTALGVEVPRRLLDGHDGHVRAPLTDGIGGYADQYSCLMTKYDPRIVPASLDLWRANVKRDASSAGMSIPSDSLKPTARFSGPSTVYITFTDSPLS